MFFDGEFNVGYLSVGWISLQCFLRRHGFQHNPRHWCYSRLVHSSAIRLLTRWFLNVYLVSLQRAFTNHNVSPTFTNHNITNMICHTRYTPVQPGSPSWFIMMQGWRHCGRVGTCSEQSRALLLGDSVATKPWWWLVRGSDLTFIYWGLQLDDGWPESVEEQGLLLLVWRRNFRNDLWKMCHRQSRRGVSRQDIKKCKTIYSLHRRHTFTHIHFYTQTLLHTNAFTHRNFDTQ